MASVFRLFFLSAILISVSSCSPGYKISNNDLRLAKSGKLNKTTNAVVVAGGRFYSRHFLWGVVEQPLNGSFYRSPQKPGSGIFPTQLIKGSAFAKGLHRVTIIPAGTWVMHDWFVIQASPYGYSTISARNPKPSGLARFTVKPGEVVYIGELTIRAHKGDSTNKGPTTIRNDMDAARRALANEYPKLTKRLVYRPMRLTL